MNAGALLQAIPGRMLARSRFATSSARFSFSDLSLDVCGGKVEEHF